MSSNDFELIVTTVAKEFERIEKISVKGSQVRATVKSITGLTSWVFSLNFNDNGFLTGEYRINSDNNQSDVPHFFAERIKQAVRSFPNIKINEEKLIPEVKESDYHKLLMKHIADIHDLDKKTDTIEVYKKKYIKCAISIPIIIAVLLMFFCGILYSVNNYKPKTTIDFSVSAIKDKMLDEVINMFEASGFTNIRINVSKELEPQNYSKEYVVKSVTIDGNQKFRKGNKYNNDAKIVITYYAAKEMELPFSTNYAIFRNYKEIFEKLQSCGFFNIKLIPMDNWQTIYPKESVVKIEINGSTSFEKESMVRPDMPIIIYYKNN